MNLQQLLKYQDVDRKLFALQRKVSTSETAQKINYYNNMKNDAANEIMKNIRILDEQLANLEKNRKNYTEIDGEISDIINVCESFQELKEVDFYEKKIAQMQKELETIERDISKINKSITDINAACKNALNNGKMCIQKLAELKVIYDNLRQEIDVQLKPIKDELDALEKDIEPRLLDRYLQVRKQNKVPVIVEYNEESKSCKGCNMDIDYNLRIKLDEGIIECPNCGRIIYKIKK